MRDWVRAALIAHLGVGDDCTMGPWIHELWADEVVFEHDGKTYQAGYAVEASTHTARLTTEPVRVERQWVPSAVGAVDSARLVRVDFVAPIHMDPEREDGILATPDPSTGFLKLDGRLTRTGVFRYRDAEGNEWGELRPEDEVFDAASLDSFKSVVVTNDHPPQFVDTRTVRDVQVGHVGSDVHREADFVRASITVTDGATIQAIRDGKTELSCGYTAELVPEQGVVDGEAYAGRQTKIRGNHVAIVDRGRAGPECALLDRRDGAAVMVSPPTSAPPRRDASTPQTPGPTMKLSDILKQAREALSAKKIDAVHGHMKSAVTALKAQKNDGAAEKAQKAIELLGKGLEMGDEELLGMILEKVSMMAGAAPEAPPEPEPESDMGEEESEEEEDMGGNEPPAYDSADVIKMQAKIDALEAARKKDAQTEAARIDARVKLVSTVSRICPELKTDGQSDEALMRAVVLQVAPDLKSRLDANASSPGYLRASYDAAVEEHDRRGKNADELTLMVRGRQLVDAEDRVDLDDLAADFHKRRADRSRARPGEAPAN